MKKKHQVFVSSTYTDMLAERQAVVEAILRAGHIPAGMELFAAGDRSQLDVIRTWIDESDIFMLILGGRYGSIDKDSGKSYIQLEYEYAIKKGKPYFAAVMSDEYRKAKVKEMGEEVIEGNNPALLKVFRETVKSSICREFNDPTELKLIVFESLGDFARRPDLPGWVRSEEVVDPKSTFEEIDRLRGENAKLTKQLGELQKGNAVIDFDGLTFEEIAERLASAKVNMKSGSQGAEDQAAKRFRAMGVNPEKISLLRLFLRTSITSQMAFHLLWSISHRSPPESRVWDWRK